MKGALRIPVNLDLRNCNFMAAKSPEMLVNFAGNAEGTPHKMRYVIILMHIYVSFFCHCCLFHLQKITPQNSLVPQARPYMTGLRQKCGDRQELKYLHNRNIYFKTMSPKETICAGFSDPGPRCEELCKFLLTKLS